MSRAPHFAPFLEERMAQLNLYPAKLAQLMGVTNQAVLNWRRGSQPKLPLLPKLAEVLRVDLPTVTRAAGYPVPAMNGPDSLAGEGTRRATEESAIAGDLRRWLAQGGELVARLEALAARS